MLIVIDDDTGNPVKEILENTENNALYDILKELIVALSRLDWENTK